jgi:hypothetical protein
MAPFAWMAEQAAGAWNAIRNGASDAWNSISNAPAAVVGSVRGVLDGIIRNAESAWTAITTSASSAWARVGTGLAAVGDFFIAPFQSLASGASRAMGSIKASIAGGLAAAKTGATDISEILSNPSAALQGGVQKFKFGIDRPEPQSPPPDTLLSAINRLIFAFKEATKAISLAAAKSLSVSAMAAPVLIAGTALAAPIMPVAAISVAPVPVSNPSVVPPIQQVPARVAPVAPVKPPALSAPLELWPELNQPISLPPAKAFVEPVLAASMPAIAGTAVLQPAIPTIPDMQGNVLLTPMMTQQPIVPLQETPGEQPAQQSLTSLPRVAPTIEQSRLLMETRTVRPETTGATGVGEVHVIRTLLERAIAEIQSLADRPIDLSVNTKLDGRQIAQSVYKDLRERKVKNYETL